MGILLGLSLYEYDMVASSDLLRVFVLCGDSVTEAVASSEKLAVWLGSEGEMVAVAVTSSDMDAVSEPL